MVKMTVGVRCQQQQISDFVSGVNALSINNLKASISSSPMISWHKDDILIDRNKALGSNSSTSSDAIGYRRGASPTSLGVIIDDVISINFHHLKPSYRVLGLGTSGRNGEELFIYDYISYLMFCLFGTVEFLKFCWNGQLG